MEDTNDMSDRGEGAAETGESIDTAVDAEAGKAGSKRTVLFILAGVVVTGLAAGYSWIRKLPKD